MKEDNNDTGVGPWGTYGSWNQAIADELFGAHHAGLPVYLGVGDETLRRIAKRAGVRDTRDPKKALHSAVLPTLDLPPRQGVKVFHRHVEKSERWRRGSLTEPSPCVGVLMFLVTVAQEMQADDQYKTSNYYDRLRLAIGLDEERKAKLQADFRDQTPYLWDSLSTWLEAHDGRKGLFTAAPLGTRRYVGLPISQAIVREQDRKRLPLMFAQYGLQPGQTIPPAELVPYLRHWLPHSPVTPSLKRLCKDGGETVDRVAEVASLELEAWDGTFPNGGGYRTEDGLSRLLLGADLRSHRRPQLRLLLAARETQSALPGSYHIRLTTGSSEHGSGADNRNLPSDTVRLEKLAGVPLLTVDTQKIVSPANLLYSSVRLGWQSLSAEFTWSPKRVLLLRYHQEFNLYLEASRAELLEPMLLLVHETVKIDVLPLLEHAAREGYVALTPETLPGLPEGWLAIRDVTLWRAPDVEEGRYDLKALVPAARAHISFQGGLSLPGTRIWHVGRPPEAQVVTTEHRDPVTLSLRAEWAPTDMSRTQWSLGETKGGTAAIDLSSTCGPLPPGNYRLYGEDSKLNTVLSAAVKLRDATTPRSVKDLPGATLVNGIEDADPISALTPLSRRELPRKPRILVLGAGIARPGGRRSKEVHREALTTDLPTLPGVLFSGDGAYSDESPPPAVSPTIEPPACFSRGYHHWLCDSMDLNTPREDVRQVCRDCAVEQWPEPRRKGGQARKNRVQADPADAGIRPLPRLQEQRTTLDYELLLDAIGYAGAGSWPAFEAMVRVFDDSPWFPIEFARRLSALGHLEVGLDRLNLRPTCWRVVPPGLVVPRDTNRPPFLYGKRDEALLYALMQETEAADGYLEFVDQPSNDGPQAIRIRNLSSDRLAEVTERVRAQNGIRLMLSTGPSEDILQELPSLSSLLQRLPATEVPLDDGERLDLVSGKWKPVKEIHAPGAYRLGLHPRRFILVSCDQHSRPKAHIAEPRVIKYLAAIQEGRSIIGYDSSSTRLIVPFGAPLPGLLERAAVMESGLLPEPLERGYLSYTQVRNGIARAIWSLCH